MSFLFGDWLDFINTEPFDFFFDRWNLHDRGNGIFKLRLGYKPLYVVSGKEYVDLILHNRASNGFDFIRGEGFEMVRSIFGEKNLGVLEDQPYKDKRGLIHRHFGQPKVLQYQERIQNVIDEWLNNFKGTDDFAKSVGELSCDITGSIFVHQDQSSIKIKEASRRLGDLITLLSKTAFTPYPLWFKRFYEKITACTDLHIPFLPEPLQPKVWNEQRRCKEEYYEELERFITLVLEEKYGEPSDSTLFYSLIEEYKDKNTDEMKTDLAAIFFAGQDTTTSTIVWLMVELHRHPDIKRKVKECNDDHYIMAVIMETLRLDPPAPGTIRNLRGDNVDLGPFTLKDGDHVFIYNYAINRNKEYWGEDANEWVPDRMLRFYEKHGKWPSEVREACFSTFVDGQHKCPGRRILVPVVLTFIKEFLKRFDYTIEECDLSPKIEIVSLPKSPIKLTTV